MPSRILVSIAAVPASAAQVSPAGGITEAILDPGGAVVEGAIGRRINLSTNGLGCCSAGTDNGLTGAFSALNFDHASGISAKRAASGGREHLRVGIGAPRRTIWTLCPG